MKFIQHYSGSRGNLYEVVAKNGKRLMVECGVNWKDIQRAFRYDFGNVVACLITHEHKEPTKEFERKFSKWAKDIKLIDTQEKLNAFIGQTLVKDVEAKANDFKNAFLFFHERSLQRYRLRYILGKLTQYIDQQMLGVYEDRNLDNYLMKGIEIEHILPQTPEKELRDSFGDDYDEFKSRLGNLTLFEKPQNIVAGNNYFDEKKSLYKTSKFNITKSIAVIETVGSNSAVNRTNKYLKSFNKWDKETIKERQELLFKIGLDIWQIRLMG